MQECNIDGCSNPRKSRGWCQTHYGRFVRNGDPNLIVKPYRRVLARLAEGIATNSDECLKIDWFKSRPAALVNNKLMPASRAAWTLVHGDPGDRMVLHTCGQGWQGCVNLRHLYLGTAKQNSQDSVRHGSIARGERSGMAVLTEDQVRQMRAEHVPGVMQAAADKYGISRSQYFRIIRRQSWTHI